MGDGGPNAESFAALLRRLRRRKGLTQEQLAEASRVSWRSVSDFERGATRTPHRDTVALLADALGLDGDERATFEAVALQDPRAHQSSPQSAAAASAAPDARAPTPGLPTGGYLGACPTTPMIARNAESGRVLTALHDAATGRGRLIMLTGEAGVGKTRLAQEAMIRAREMGFVVLIGRCYEEHVGSPFFPFLEALAAAWAAASPALREQAAVRFRDLGRLLPDAVLPAPMSSDDPRPRPHGRGRVSPKSGRRGTSGLARG